MRTQTSPLTPVIPPLSRSNVSDFNGTKITPEFVSPTETQQNKDDPPRRQNNRREEDAQVDLKGKDHQAMVFPHTFKMDRRNGGGIVAIVPYRTKCRVEHEPLLHVANAPRLETTTSLSCGLRLSAS